MKIDPTATTRVMTIQNTPENAGLLSFCLDGISFRGIGEDYCPTVTVSHPDSRVTVKNTVGKKNGLSIRYEEVFYSDFPVFEVTAYFTNEGNTDTGILSRIRPYEGSFVLNNGEAPILMHGSGDTRGGDGYHSFETPITKEPLVIAPADDGCCCNGAWPYMRLRTGSSIYTIAIGWTSTWQATFSQGELVHNDGYVIPLLNVDMGQKHCHFRIRPGETMRTPRVLIMQTEGDDVTQAINAWRRFYRAHIMPLQWGQPISPKACMHVHGAKRNGAPMPEFFGATEDNQIYGLRQYIAKGLKPDLWWFDAGMYPLDCAPWPACGNLYCDPARFPNGTMEQIGRECERHGIDFMLWFEPERSTVGSELEREHPEFLLTPSTPNSVEGINSLLWLGNPDALNWLIDRVDSMIKRYHVHVYRQDFNFDPFNCFREFEEEDRLGAVENLHVQGYYRFWDELLLRNPGLVIDSCASGGRRNDLETMRRSVPFQYTDVGVGDHPTKQLQHGVMFEWIPYFRAHTYAWDNDNRLDIFAFLNAMAPAVTLTTPIWCEREEDFAVARSMLPIWRRAAMIECEGDYYPEMTSTGSPKDFFCTHFYDDQKEEGFVLFLRNRECEVESFTASLHISPEGRYRVEDPIAGTSYEASGSELSSYTVSLPKRSGSLLFLSRID